MIAPIAPALPARADLKPNSQVPLEMSAILPSSADG